MQCTVEELVSAYGRDILNDPRKAWGIGSGQYVSGPVVYAKTEQCTHMRDRSDNTAWTGILVKYSSELTHTRLRYDWLLLPTTKKVLGPKSLSLPRRHVPFDTKGGGDTMMGACDQMMLPRWWVPLLLGTWTSYSYTS